MGIKKLLRQSKYSASTLYLLAQDGKKDGFNKALRFHERKIAVIVAFLIFVCQMLMVLVLQLV